MPFNFSLWEKEYRERIFRHHEAKDKFTEIYRLNAWGNEESLSGDGSTLQYTANLRRELPVLFKEFDIKSVFDGPCGDFNWMKEVVKDQDIDYIGGDIVQHVIDENAARYQTDRIRFVAIDMTSQDLPRADLMICRDCLFHLSDENIKGVLTNFVKSGTPYLLTTNHLNRSGFRNRNIVTGSFRLVDLFSAPYNFPDPPLFRISDWMPPFEEREMCLWTRNQVAAVLDCRENFSSAPPDPTIPL